MHHSYQILQHVENLKGNVKAIDIDIFKSFLKFFYFIFLAQSYAM